MATRKGAKGSTAAEGKEKVIPAGAAGRGRQSGHKAGSAVKRMKTFRLAQSKIQRARKILGTDTDTSTIEAALDMVVFRKDLTDGLAAMAGLEVVSPEAMDAPSA